MIHFTSIFVKWEKKQNFKKCTTFLRTVNLLLVCLLLAALNTQTSRIHFFLMFCVWSLRSPWTGSFTLHGDSVNIVTLSSSGVTYFFSSMWLMGKGNMERHTHFLSTMIPKGPVSHPATFHFGKGLSLSPTYTQGTWEIEPLNWQPLPRGNLTPNKEAHISCVGQGSLL